MLGQEDRQRKGRRCRDGVCLQKIDAKVNTLCTMIQ